MLQKQLNIRLIQTINILCIHYKIKKNALEMN